MSIGCSCTVCRLHHSSVMSLSQFKCLLEVFQMQICLQALCWELLFCSHIFFIVVFPTLFVLQAYCICVYFSLFSLFVQLIHDQCAYYLTCFNYCMQLENRTEQSRTEYWNRVRIPSCKTAKLIRVIYRIAAGAVRVSASSSRTHQQGGSLLERGLEPASSSWRIISSSYCATMFPTNTAWPEWEWWTGTQIIWAEWGWAEVTSEEQNRAKRAKEKP